MKVTKNAVKAYLNYCDQWAEMPDLMNSQQVWLFGKVRDNYDCDCDTFYKNGVKITKKVLFEDLYGLMVQIKELKKYSDKRTLELFNIYQDIAKEMQD